MTGRGSSCSVWLPAVARRALFSLAALCAFCDASLLCGQVQDFSEARLREGREAYRMRRPIDAVDPIRIAAFGLLDRPRELCEALVYLALAEDAAGRRGDAQGVVARLSEIERRLPACSEANVDAPARADFLARFGRPLFAVAVSAAPRPQAPAVTPQPPVQLPVSEGAPSIAAAEPPAAKTEPPPSTAKTEPPAPNSPNRTDAGESAEAPPEPAAMLDAPPRVRRTVPIVYPRFARDARISGIVVVRVLVSEAGRAQRIEVVGGPRPLADAAVVSVNRWTFEPGRSGGREVAAWLTVEIPFNLLNP